MFVPVDGSIYFWPRTIVEGVRALLWVLQMLMRPVTWIVSKWWADPAGREAEIGRLRRQIREIEREHRSVVRLAERAVAQRDRYYDLYLQALSAKSAA